MTTCFASEHHPSIQDSWSTCDIISNSWWNNADSFPNTSKPVHQNSPHQTLHTPPHIRYFKMIKKYSGTSKSRTSRETKNIRVIEIHFSCLSFSWIFIRLMSFSKKNIQVSVTEIKLRTISYWIIKFNTCLSRLYWYSNYIQFASHFKFKRLFFLFQNMKFISLHI
jgi:hypothetical protein